jgi:hypothetical protein
MTPEYDLTGLTFGFVLQMQNALGSSFPLFAGLLALRAAVGVTSLLFDSGKPKRRGGGGGGGSYENNTYRTGR